MPVFAIWREAAVGSARTGRLVVSDDLAGLAAVAYIYGFPLVFDLQMVGGRDGDDHARSLQHVQPRVQAGRAAGFLGTELYRDAVRANRFLTIDRWQNEEDWQSFLHAFGGAYESLDAQLEGLPVAERPLFEGSS